MTRQIFSTLILTSIGILFGVMSLLAQEIPEPMKMKSAMTEIWEPEVVAVTPGVPDDNGATKAPSDAVVLFDGKDLSAWENKDGKEAGWMVHDGVFTVEKGTGDIFTKQKFEDFQLHIEWKVPAGITGENQARGNSGIFLQNVYEIQVLDSYENRTYKNGQAGSIYKQSPPLKNAMRPPGQWNVFDIIYTAPRFKDDGTLFHPAYVTVIHNGVVIQNHTQITGHTPNTGLPRYTAHGKGSIRLQDHRDPSEA
ncbi:MAG: DUF1080 domain-containing protein, partial [Saprospiraceae bacterium]|nr:DUF1080 domain-containing protein [Saprospiraceae bacterium]